MRIFIFLLTCCLSIFNESNSQPEIDSIYQDFRKYPNHQEIPDSLVYELINLSMLKDISKIEPLLPMLQEMQDQRDSLFFYTVLFTKALLLKKNDNIQEAILLFERYIDFQLKNPKENNTIESFYFLGHSFYSIKDYKNAIIEYKKAKKIAIKDAFLWIPIIATDLGEIYRKQDLINKAIQEYNFVLQQPNIDPSNLARINMYLAETHIDQNELDSAETYTSQMIALSARNNLMNFLYKGKLYEALIDYEKTNYGNAIKLSKKLISHYDIHNKNKNLSLLCRKILSKSLYKSGDYINSKIIFQELLEFSKTFDDLKYQRVALKGLLHCNTKLGNVESIMGIVNQLAIVTESIRLNSAKEKIKKLKTKYNLEKKEKQILLLNAQNEISKLKLQTAQRNSMFAVIGAFSLLAISFLLFYFIRLQKISKQQLADKNKILSTAVRDKELLLKEIHHRVKNNLQVVSSLLSLQSEYIKDDNALSAINEGRNRVRSMALIHQNLYQENDLTGIKVKTYFSKLTSGLLNSYEVSKGKINLLLDIDDLIIDIDTIIPLGLITNELISNSLKYAFVDLTEGQLNISLKKLDKKLILKIADNGLGFDSSIINDNISSFGYQMIQAFCEKLNAQLNISSTNGTAITISLDHS